MVGMTPALTPAMQTWLQDEYHRLHEAAVDLMRENGDTDVDPEDLDGTESETCPGVNYLAAQLHLIRRLRAEAERLDGGGRALPTYAGLERLLRKVLVIEPDHHFGRYHQLAEATLLPLVNRALAYLGLTGLEATGWHPNDHWIDGILVVGRLRKSGRLCRLRGALGDLVDVSGGKAVAQTVREVARQLWFLYLIDQGVYRVRSLRRLHDDCGRLRVPDDLPLEGAGRIVSAAG